MGAAFLNSAYAARQPATPAMPFAPAPSLRSSASASTAASTRRTKNDATDSVPSAAKAPCAAITSRYASMENSRVKFTCAPRWSNSLPAAMPSGVDGTLTITFGLPPTRKSIRMAASTISSVRSNSGLISMETNPSAPSVSRCTPASMSAAQRLPMRRHVLRMPPQVPYHGFPSISSITWNHDNGFTIISTPPPLVLM